jgi:hypothetical protein
VGRVVRIANAGGYWGDDPDALSAQVEGGPIDYLTIDYLAEITMAILERQRKKDPSKGYATDFVAAAAAVLPRMLEKKIRLVTNAGGVNPEACAAALREAAGARGLAPRIAVVSGPAVDVSRLAPSHAETGAPFAEIAGRIVASYVYVGARPIAVALGRGADVVITGRVADASLVVGPLVHEFGWSWDDWDHLAAATVAGHVLECGAQATGGNLTDWREVAGLSRVGYPIAEASDDGTFVVTKHPSTGGVVNRKTVVEQLLYEIGDPRAYASPDVTADFTSLALEEAGRDRIRIVGVRGVPPPPTLKAGIAFAAGWKSAGAFLFGPSGAEEKARAMALLFWERVGHNFAETVTEIFGQRETLLRLGARDPDREKVESFSRRFASLALSGPPGVASPGGGRPPVQEAWGLWPAAVPRGGLSALVRVGDEEIEVACDAPSTCALPAAPREAPATTRRGSSSGRASRLLDLAFARSGDKGDTANIGVAARDAESYRLLKEALTVDFVRDVFREECHGDVVRYELPNLLAFNFVLKNALGGGGVLSLRSDPQGKTFAQRLLDATLTP